MYTTDNLILNQGCSQKCNNNENENIHVDNNKMIMEIVKEKVITINSEDGKDEFSVFKKNTSTLVHSLSSSVSS